MPGKLFHGATSIEGGKSHGCLTAGTWHRAMWGRERLGFPLAAPSNSASGQKLHMSLIDKRPRIAYKISQLLSDS
jgi:hypothetical protein